jgi:transposase
MKVMGRPYNRLVVDGPTRRELERRFRQVKDVRDRRRLETVRLACTGQHSLEQIADTVGCSRAAVQIWLDKFKREGLEGLLVRRKPGASKSPLQEPPIQRALGEELAAGNFRTAGQLARWLEQRFGVKRSAKSLYYWLKKCGAVLRVPRPVHLKKDPQAAEAFVAGLEAKLRALPLEPGRPVRLWVQDEGRFGLHTIVRRCWGLRGVRVVKTQQKKYQWGYLYGALEIGTGRTEALFMPHAALEVSEAFLKHLAQSEPAAEHVVIWDGAGFHQKSGTHALPDRVHVVQLPGYSPELNPVEKLWDVLKDGLCNRLFHSMEELWQALCRELEPFYQPARVHQLLGHSPLLACANASSNQ